MNNRGNLCGVDWSVCASLIIVQISSIEIVQTYPSIRTFCSKKLLIIRIIIFLFLFQFCIFCYYNHKYSIRWNRVTQIKKSSLATTIITEYKNPILNSSIEYGSHFTSIAFISFLKLLSFSNFQVIDRKI